MRALRHDAVHKNQCNTHPTAPGRAARTLREPSDVGFRDLPRVAALGGTSMGTRALTRTTATAHVDGASMKGGRGHTAKMGRGRGGGQTAPPLVCRPRGSSLLRMRVHGGHLLSAGPRMRVEHPSFACPAKKRRPSLSLGLVRPRTPSPQLRLQCVLRCVNGFSLPCLLSPSVPSPSNAVQVHVRVAVCEAAHTSSLHARTHAHKGSRLPLTSVILLSTSSALPTRVCAGEASSTVSCKPFRQPLLPVSRGCFSVAALPRLSRRQSPEGGFPPSPGARVRSRRGLTMPSQPQPQQRFLASPPRATAVSCSCRTAPRRSGGTPPRRRLPLHPLLRLQRRRRLRVPSRPSPACPRK